MEAFCRVPRVAFKTAPPRYTQVCVLVIALSIVTLIWTIITAEPDLVTFWLMEIVIVGAMVFDVCVRVLSQGAHLFFRYWANWYVSVRTFIKRT
jgi:hypothetical protein